GLRRSQTREFPAEQLRRLDSESHGRLQVPGRLRSDFKKSSEDDYSPAAYKKRRRLSVPLCCGGRMTSDNFSPGEPKNVASDSLEERRNTPGPVSNPPCCVPTIIKEFIKDVDT